MSSTMSTRTQDMSLDTGKIGKEKKKMVKIGTGHGDSIELGGICVVLAVYLLVLLIFTFGGAAVFMVVDGPSDHKYEQEQKARCNDTKHKAIRKFLARNGRRKLNETGRLLTKAFNGIVRCMNESDDTAAYPLYKFENAALYTLSTFTTLGYGNVNTKSTLGRFLSIMYAYIGVPLFFGFYLDSSTAIRLLINNMVYWMGFATRIHPRHIPRLEVTSKFTEHKRSVRRITLILNTLLFIILMIILMFITQSFEPEWDLLDCAYFVFHSIDLVGYGDVMPKTGWTLCLLTPPILLGTLLFGSIALILQEEFQLLLIFVVDFSTAKLSEEDRDKDCTREAEAFA